DENPTTSLIDGVVKFHQKLTPPVPMRDIEEVIEFDPTAYESLFS
ncbi:MAG: phage tail sheath family protein, partial [Veillonella sp.]|nr:phage tail sheath family protein [Veillonella sp.]